MSGEQQIRERERVVNMLAFLQNSNVVAICSNEEFKKFVGIIQAHGFSALIPWPMAEKGYDDYVADSLKKAARIPGRIACGGKLFVSDPKQGGDGAPEGASKTPESRVAYTDGAITVRCEQELAVWTAVSCDGEAAAARIDDNFFSEAEIVRIYRKVWNPDWGDPAAAISALKRWLIGNGADPAALEE